MNLNDIFTKEDVRLIVLYTIGYEMKSEDYEDVGLETFNQENLKNGNLKDYEIFDLVENNSPQQLIIKGKNCEVVIFSDGYVCRRNYGGCTFRPKNPLALYEVILSKRELLKEHFPEGWNF